eukprot:gene16195-22358_t
MEDHLLNGLKSNFGLQAFRPFQREAIEATLCGLDSIVLMSTGAGKSLVFQLPPCVTNKTTVVISPLLALAKDQVKQAEDRDIDARLWNSEISEASRCSIVRELLSEASELGTICSFAIDEAHCISEWGHDFRPAYLQLSSLKEDFPGVPVACFTASCTASVQRSIVTMLNLDSPRIIKSSFNRSNIRYEVRHKELIGDGSDAAILDDLADFLASMSNSGGIIYARLRTTCDWLYQELSAKDLDVGVYHAGKDPSQRARVQTEWSEGSLSAVVATIAFGMGIDRADVRWVVHWNAPSSMEGLYQESGRAGRDGLPSSSIVYASKADLEAGKKMERGCRGGSVALVAGYCYDSGCRRKNILEYFDERGRRCSQAAGDQLCDYCNDPKAVKACGTKLEQCKEKSSMAASIRGAMSQAAGPLKDGASSEDQDNGVPYTRKRPAVWMAASNISSESKGPPPLTRDPQACIPVTAGVATSSSILSKQVLRPVGAQVQQTECHAIPPSLPILKRRGFSSGASGFTVPRFASSTKGLKALADARENAPFSSTCGEIPATNISQFVDTHSQEPTLQQKGRENVSLNSSSEVETPEAGPEGGDALAKGPAVPPPVPSTEEPSMLRHINPIVRRSFKSPLMLADKSIARS